MSKKILVVVRSAAVPVWFTKLCNSVTGTWRAMPSKAINTSPTNTPKKSAPKNIINRIKFDSIGLTIPIEGKCKIKLLPLKMRAAKRGADHAPRRIFIPLLKILFWTS